MKGKSKLAGIASLFLNKLVVSSLNGSQAAWEESYAEVGGKWDLSQTQKIYTGGDGADWPKQGIEYFPGAEYCLDPYHLSKHLTETLWHDEETFQKVATAISRSNWQETQEILTEAAKKSRGNRKKRITKLMHYLGENWAGITTSLPAGRQAQCGPADETPGSQVDHYRWRPDGPNFGCEGKRKA